MSKGAVINNPEDLHKFAKNLQHKVAEAQELQRLLEYDLKSIGEAWRDQTYYDFCEFFQANQKMLQAMYEQVEVFSLHAEKKAGILDDYNNEVLRR